MVMFQQLRKWESTESTGEMKLSSTLDYADDINILDENVSTMNELLEVLRVLGARICLNVNIKKTKSLRLGMNDDEEIMLGNKKIHQMGRFSCQGSIISKDGGCSKDVRSRITKGQGIFPRLESLEEY